MDGENGERLRIRDRASLGGNKNMLKLTIVITAIY